MKQRAEKAEAELAYSQERRAETAKLHTEALNGWAEDKALYAEARGHVAEAREIVEHALMNVKSLTGGDERRMSAFLKKTETKR